MSRTDGLEPVISTVLAFVTGYLLWPPGYVYWVAVADVVGVVPVWIGIVGICIGFGYGVRRFTPIAPRDFAVGGLLAYVLGMYLISATMTPDSPVHFFMYGFMLGCTIFGTVTRESLGTLVGVLDAVASR